MALTRQVRSFFPGRGFDFWKQDSGRNRSVAVGAKRAAGGAAFVLGVPCCSPSGILPDRGGGISLDVAAKRDRRRMINRVNLPRPSAPMRSRAVEPIASRTVNTGHVPTERERVLGCLLGGAIGDALGAPIEFDRLADIRARHGAKGVTRFLSAYGTVGAITDDTQMSLFTAEGLLRAQARCEQGGEADDVASIRRAYLRWLRTQDGSVRNLQPTSPSTATNFSSGVSFFQYLSDRLWEKHRFRSPAGGGWLLDQRVLHHQRAPGRTCLSALYEGGRGTADEPLNNSKGCGGVAASHRSAHCQIAGSRSVSAQPR